MRTQQLKKIQNRPMRSPSPDLVSKSSIKNTEVDTDYVHRYIDNKNGRQSKSPRITNKSLSFQVQQNPTNEIEILKQRIKELEYRNNQLLLQNQSMAETNSKMHIVNEPPTRQRNQSSVRQFSPLSSARSNISEYKDKLIQLMEQNHRLSKKLQDRQERYQKLKEENQKNQYQILMLKNNSEPSYTNMDLIKTYFNEYIEPRIRNTQLDWDKKLKDMEDKVTAINNVQYSLKEKVPNIHKNPSKNRNLQPNPSKMMSIKESKISRVSSEKNNMFEPFKMSMMDSSKMSRNNPEKKLLTEIDHQNQEEFSRISEENEKLKKQNQQLSSLVKYFKNQLQNARNKCNQLEKDKKNEIFVSSKLEYQEQELRNQMKRINDLEIENEKLNEEINRLNAKLYTASKDQTEKIRKYYEDLLKKKDLDIGKQLRMYLENLRSIKKSIEDSKIDDILHENEIYTEEKMTIEKQLKMIKQQNQKIINELKKKLILQEHKIIELEKDKKLMLSQISELNVQKQKLKQSMIEFDSIKMVTEETFVDVSTENKNKSYNKIPSYKVKGCLKDTIAKIDNLQEKITKILNQ